MKRKQIILICTAVCIIIGIAAVIFQKKADTYEITLSENATTGYMWSYTMSEEGIVEETSAEYTSRDKECLVGAASDKTWTFKALKPGNVTLTFSYARSWEKEAISTAVYQLKVTDGLQIEEVSVTSDNNE